MSIFKKPTKETIKAKLSKGKPLTIKDKKDCDYIKKYGKR